MIMQKIEFELLGWICYKTDCFPKAYKCCDNNAPENNRHFFETVQEAKNFIARRHLDALYPKTIIESYEDPMSPKVRAVKWYHEDDLEFLLNHFVDNRIWFSIKPVGYESDFFWVSVEQKYRNVLDNITRDIFNG